MFYFPSHYKPKNKRQCNNNESTFVHEQLQSFVVVFSGISKHTIQQKKSAIFFFLWLCRTTWVILLSNKSFLLFSSFFWKAIEIEPVTELSKVAHELSPVLVFFFSFKMGKCWGKIVSVICKEMNRMS